MSDNRPLHYAILASLALHALLLFGLRDMIDTARRAASFPPPLIARLLEPEPAAVALPEIAIPKKEPAKKPQAQVRSVPEPAPRSAEIPAQPAAASAPEAQEAPAAVPPQVAAIEPRAAPSPPAAELPESLSRDQYRVQLIDEARRHKRYPPLARENNWQGTVVVAVAIGANGRASVSLRASSGYEVLDRQALEMFGRAAHALPVPPALRGKEFALEVRAVYSLED